MRTKEVLDEMAATDNRDLPIKDKTGKIIAVVKAGTGCFTDEDGVPIPFLNEKELDVVYAEVRTLLNKPS